MNYPLLNLPHFQERENGGGKLEIFGKAGIEGNAINL